MEKKCYKTELTDVIENFLIDKKIKSFYREDIEKWVNGYINDIVELEIVP
jgi:hypothetical protein